MGHAMIALLAYVAAGWTVVSISVAIIIGRMIRERDQH